VTVNSVVISHGNDNQHPQNKNPFFQHKGCVISMDRDLYLYTGYICCKCKRYVCTDTIFGSNTTGKKVCENV